MSNYIRPRIAGATIYFTVRLRHRRSDLLLREITQLRTAVRQTLIERPVKVRAWVILPDHMHCIWTLPEHDHDYSTRWRLIKSRFSRNIPMGYQRNSDIPRQERGIWQRRFWEHHIRDTQDYDLHMQHCWNDPVRHGLVSKPEHWEFTSFAKLQRVSAKSA